MVGTELETSVIIFTHPPMPHDKCPDVFLKFPIYHDF